MAVQRTRQIEIDPMFHVPQGVEDVRQQNKIDGQFSYSSESIAQDPILETPTSVLPMPPTTFTIVDQAVRIGPDGRSVVDVTIEFPDVSGISNIDIRTTTI